jgi:succinate-semialdehyde dehydrogenase/glutarate-semialdehyde dehydrogenase
VDSLDPAIASKRHESSRKTSSSMGDYSMSMVALNPADGSLIQSYDETSNEEVTSAIQSAHQAHLDWKKTPFSQRAQLMHNAARILRERAREFGELMTMEMGKPISGGVAEAEKCAWVCEYYADNAESFLADQEVESDAGRSFITFRPIGVVLAVMPWNFPFWQVFRFVAPNLMAGNAGLLKHASNVPGCALAIEEIMREAGFPKGLFRSLLIPGSRVEGVIEHPLVRAVTLTGSTLAGKAVAKKAGEVLKKTVLELGGSDPYVILEDADLDEAAEVCATARLINSGQSCIAAKRFIVVERIRNAFEEKFLAAMKAAKFGDPMKEDTVVGPQARADLRDELHDQVVRSVAAGARCILGGKIPPGPGAYYPPTILTEVAPGMAAYQEELFGPVAAVIPVRGEAEAIRVANDSVFGLGAAIFTRDLEKGTRIAAESLEAGACFVNAFVRSDPRLPFGGVKESGYGRELSPFGILEFVNIKTVWVA